MEPLTLSIYPEERKPNIVVRHGSKLDCVLGGSTPISLLWRFSHRNYYDDPNKAIKKSVEISHHSHCGESYLVINPVVRLYTINVDMRESVLFQERS